MADVPRQGYKLVNRDDWTAFHGSIVYAVGSTHALPPDELPVLGARGFHFCRRALDCLPFSIDDATDWGYPQFPFRLVRVTVPDGAVVVTDGRGAKFAASALSVAEEVVDTDALLTGTLSYPSVFSAGVDFDVHFVRGRMHNRPDGAAAIVERRRDTGTVVYTWLRESHFGRDDGGPTLLHVAADGVALSEGWLPRGEAGPVARYRRPDGTLRMARDTTAWLGVDRVTTYADDGVTVAEVRLYGMDGQPTSPDPKEPSQVVYVDGRPAVYRWHRQGKVIADIDVSHVRDVSSVVKS
jgi:hypothetical protein